MAAPTNPADSPPSATTDYTLGQLVAYALRLGSLGFGGPVALVAELEVEDGNLMYSFEIVRPDKKISEVEIDAGNGKVLDIDND